MSILTNETLLETLSETACRVLETAAFAFAEPAEDGEEFGFDDGVEARLIMAGDIEAILTIAAPLSLCRALAADIVGLDFEDMSPHDAADALGEMANVIAGSLSTDLLGEQADVALSPPRCRRIEPSEWKAFSTEPTSIQLLVEEQPLTLSLSVSGNQATTSLGEDG